MILKHLQLTSFKSHLDGSFDFDDRINCITGKNGVGKTNLLDAIYYLSFTKSAVGSLDRFGISNDAPAFILFGTYDQCTIALQYERAKMKTLKLDGQEIEKFSDAIGKVPLVIILPDDTLMIKEGSDGRRKFFDGAISQFDHEYLVSLLGYNKLLKQRNELLKQQAGKAINYQLFETYDDQLIPLAKEISKKRSNIVSAFEPFLIKNYQSLHDGAEQAGLRFKSNVDDSFEERFRNDFQKDLMVQRTSQGSHKDDFEFLLNENIIKRFGSQGQQKTFIISLKFALYDFLIKETGKKPLLLLDDIFDKLDDSRIELLVKLLSDKKRFGQIFITDARADRSKTIFAQHKEVKFIDLAS